MQLEATGVTEIMKRFRRFLLGSAPLDARIGAAADRMTQEATDLRAEIASSCSRIPPDECTAPHNFACHWRKVH